MKQIWTIGHSTRDFDTFLALLKSFDIALLVDVRAHPGSRKYPHFNRDHLAATLPQFGIDYKHLEGLGGRRRPVADSPNAAWRNLSFRGYADYMQTEVFKREAALLAEWGTERRTAFMCSEAPWWRCHRALISDYLKAGGWTVWHIMNEGRSTEHPYTAPARAVQGQLFYDNDE